MLRQDLFEVKLNDEFLMSSLFTLGETELARLALARLPGDGPFDVVVGGLGLGYTAHEALADSRVGSLLVVEAIDHVIRWHRQELIPDTRGLAADPRTTLLHADFFALGFGEGRLFHAILLDIDHSPRHVLNDAHRHLYTPDGLRALSHLLHPGGVFALWSNDPPDPDFGALLDDVFGAHEACTVSFHNPFQDRESSNTVYLAAR